MDTGPQASRPAADPAPSILAIGDSITSDRESYVKMGINIRQLGLLGDI
jgi:hypothetical protein